MPDQNTPQVSSQATGWLSDAPGGDLSLDELFPNPEMVSQTPSAPAVTPPPAAPEPFLKMSTGTVYSNREEAVKGFEEKDRYIAKLRQDMEALKAQVPKPPEPTRPQSYRESPEKLFDDLVASASRGDKKAYAAALDNYFSERLATYAPLVSEAAHDRAIRELEGEIPAIRGFIGGADYQATLEKLPMLKNAIDVALNNVEAAGGLREFYRIAYLTSAGSRTQELVRTAAAQVATPPIQGRPTMQTNTPTPVPGAPVPQGNWNDLLNTREGRKAIIDAGESRGLRNVEWGKIGL